MLVEASSAIAPGGAIGLHIGAESIVKEIVMTTLKTLFFPIAIGDFSCFEASPRFVFGWGRRARDGEEDANNARDYRSDAHLSLPVRPRKLRKPNILER